MKSTFANHAANKTIAASAATFLLSLCLICLLALSACASNSPAPGSGSADATPTGENVLTVGMELAYPPFETKDDAGNPMGVSVDIITAFADAYGYEVVIENTAWEGLIPSLQTGKVDCVISSMTITEEREEIVAFTQPYAQAKLAILAYAESDITSLEDLNQEGMQVAVRTGSSGDIFATKHLTNAEIIRLSDESACVTEVVQGKVDGFIYDQLTIYRNQIANPDTTEAVFIAFEDVEYWGIAVQKGNDELLAELNEFITQARADGTFERISEEHLSEEKAAFDKLGFTWFFDIE